MSQISLCVLLAVVGVALAGYEHSCSQRDYMSQNGRRGGVCGSMLTELISMLCDGNMNMKKRAISSGQQDRKYTYYMPAIPGGVGLDRKQANSVLGVSKRNGNTGVVCECCVHRCKRSEMMQYCAPSGRRRRNVRRQITDEDIERFYDQLDSMRADDSQQDSALSYDEFEQQPIVKLLEQYKQINIAREESTETNSAGDEYGSNMADEKASQNKMSDYLRESLIRLLAKSESSVPVKSSPHLTAQENADLHSLWELFENDGKK